MNPVTAALMSVGALGLVLGFAGGLGLVPLAVLSCNSCSIPGTAAVIPGIPTCSGTNTICPSVAFQENGYKLRGWINGTEAPGVTMDNNPTGYDTSYVQISPATGTPCGSSGGTCLFSFNVSSISQGGGSFRETFSTLFPGPSQLTGSYRLSTQLLYTEPTTFNGLNPRVSLSTAPIALTIPGNQTNAGCGASCFTLSGGFSFSVSGLFAAFNDTSAVTGGSVTNETWAFGDGATATGARVTHIYASGGQYRVVESVVAQQTGGSPQLFATTNLPVNISASPSGGLVRGQTNPTSGGAGAFFHPSLLDGILIGASAALILAAWVPKNPVVIVGALVGGGALGGFLL